MNPFEHQPIDTRDITNARVRDTLREYARLEGQNDRSSARDH
jgi:hypothetical protein